MNKDSFEIKYSFSPKKSQKTSVLFFETISELFESIELDSKNAVASSSISDSKNAVASSSISDSKNAVASSSISDSKNAELSVYESDEKRIFVTDSKNAELSVSESAEKRIFVTDSNIIKIKSISDFLEIQKSKNQCVIVLPSGEENKTLENVLKIVKTAIDFGANRKSIFTAIGGGVITDMAAFASSIFMRGAKLEFVPTTLLCMVDACCGGKTGCDFEQYKNMIGSFFPANKIFICPQFLETLSDSEYNSGLVEAFKTSMLSDKKMFELFEKSFAQILSKNQDILKKLILNCLKAKAYIVSKDLTDTGKRMQLNLGHTFGHAAESVLGLGKVSHGMAVAFGIKKAIILSNKIGLCDDFYKKRVLQIIKKYEWNEKVFVKPNDLLLAMKKDKKITDSKIKLILQKGLCDTIVLDVDDDVILEVLNG